MNHFIDIVDVDGSIKQILGSHCIGLARTPNNGTSILLANHSTMVTTSTMETMQQRLNKYNDEVLMFVSKLREGGI